MNLFPYVFFINASLTLVYQCILIQCSPTIKKSSTFFFLVFRPTAFNNVHNMTLPRTWHSKINDSASEESEDMFIGELAGIDQF